MINLDTYNQPLFDEANELVRTLLFCILSVWNLINN